MSDATTSPEDRVQARAYALWEQDGRPEGRSDHHWHQARAEIEREHALTAAGAQASAQKRKTPKAKEPHPGMMGNGTEEQNLGQTGDPSGRITEAEVQEAFKTQPDGG